ncbi:hypothetical protein [Photobacterium damselae]|uniref:hypothetical protein n=1 Tax=Photobacterium damselae TaxID=38293 RepID=UPI0010FD3CC4|nr:hypothetical protein [Photobacterium damselae]TLS83890.1 hypothetical protein FD720_18905 [Photobacterium damselae subsp. damselae]
MTTCLCDTVNKNEVFENICEKNIVWVSKSYLDPVSVTEVKAYIVNNLDELVKYGVPMDRFHDSLQRYLTARLIRESLPALLQTQKESRSKSKILTIFKRKLSAYRNVLLLTSYATLFMFLQIIPTMSLDLICGEQCGLTFNDFAITAISFVTLLFVYSRSILAKTKQHTHASH